MNSKRILLLLTCSLFLSFSILGRAEGGSTTVAPATIYGTGVSFSVSYPEFHFGEPINISMVVSATFYNESISAVNITAIHIRLYDSSVNLDKVASQGYPSPTIQNAYASAFWGSSDYYGNLSSSSVPPPYKIERGSDIMASGALTIESLALDYVTTSDKETQAKVYVQVTLCLLDTDGNLVYRSVSSSLAEYHWLLFCGEGEAPYVIIRARSESFPFTLSMLALVVGSTALILSIAGIVLVKTEYKHASTVASRCFCT